MFPWLRLIRVGSSLIGKSKVDLLATTHVSLRAWPNDLDFNLHVNNGRYLALDVLLAGLGHTAPSPELPEWANRFHQGGELLSELLRDEERSKGLHERKE